MAFSKPGPKYRVTKMVEARKLHPKSFIPLSEPPLQLPFTAILDGVTLERDNYRFYYLGLPYQCPQKVMKSAIEKIEDNTVQAASNEEAVAEDLVAEVPAPAARTVKSSAAPPPDAVEGFVWQQVTTNHGALQRAKVPGGWLVKLQQNGICFYPDANHKWDGSTID